MASLARRALHDGLRLVARQDDPNIGSSQNDDKNKTNSASSVVSTLLPVLIVAIVWAALFIFILRRKFPERYRPRTFLSTLREPQRTPVPADGLFSWFGSFWGLPDSYVLTHSSLDGYLFLRFLKLTIVMCLVGCCITWPILWPVDATGAGGKQQFDLLTMANIQNSYYRYFAHAGCAYIFFGFVIFMITRESIYYINLRQAFLMAPLYAQRISSKTVLFTAVPDEYLDVAKMRKIMGDAVVNVWIPTDTKDLEKLVKERDKAINKLEGAETKLCKLANGARLKSMKKGGVAHDSDALGGDVDTETGSAAARWVSRKQRPTHRLKPLIGQKVDTIEWCRAELPGMIKKVEEEQLKHKALKDVKKINSVFVEFISLVEAQAAYQSLTHHQVLHMAPRFTGLNPAEVIWSNLRIRWYERVMRGIATTAAVTALIIFWSIPVAFIGAISNVDKLTQTKGLEWLSFINKLPQVVLGVVTGLLPVILLAVLMSLLPIFLRLMAKIGGAPTLSSVELTVQNYYFAFQVVQVFLVATLGSAASSSVGTILNNPTSITSTLANQIPLASNFYLSYIVLQGLGVVSGLVVGLVGLIIARVLSMILDNTPRKIYKRWTRLAGLGWGTVFPLYTNMMVIAICYACIAPLVLGFAAIGLFLFYLGYRYNMRFVYNLSIDTKGLVYPRALQQLFVGLYVAELCLIGLFAIKSGDSGGALGSLILMIIFLIFTALYHISLNSALTPLLNYLPKTLAAEEERLQLLDNSITETAAASSAKETTGSDVEKNGHSQPYATATAAPHKKPGLIKKFLRPDIYTDYATMRRLVPREFAQISYEPETAAEAYLHPAIASRPGTLWIPRDSCGVSRQECHDTRHVIPITDEGAHFNDKNKIVWDKEKTAPIYSEQVLY